MEGRRIGRWWRAFLRTITASTSSQHEGSSDTQSYYNNQIHPGIHNMAQQTASRQFTFFSCAQTTAHAALSSQLPESLQLPGWPSGSQASRCIHPARLLPERERPLPANRTLPPAIKSRSSSSLIPLVASEYSLLSMESRSTL